MAEITELPQIEQDKMRASLETLKRTYQYVIEYNVIQAKIRRAAYDAYCKEGFTPEQALQLCAK